MNISEWVAVISAVIAIGSLLIAVGSFKQRAETAEKTAEKTNEKMNGLPGRVVRLESEVERLRAFRHDIDSRWSAVQILQMEVDDLKRERDE